MATPHHDRRNEITGTGRIVVEQTEDIAELKFKAKLLAEFAQRRLDRGLALVAASARQRPLTAMGPQARGAPGQQQRRCAGGLIRLDQRDGDGSPL